MIDILKKYKNLIFISGLAALVLIAYSNSFRSVFLYDDKVLISGGFIKSLNFKEVFTVLCRQVFPDGVVRGVFYRPLLTLSYFLDYKLWQNSAAGYHLSNIIMHIMNCVLLFCIARTFSNSIIFSLMTTTLFSLHPIQVEAVTWIAGRNELLLTLFMLLALLLYMRNKVLWTYEAFLLALLTKESAIFLTFLFVIYDLYFSGDVRRSILKYVGFLLIIVLYLYVHYSAHCGMGASSVESPTMLLKSIGMVPLYYLNYLKLFFYPMGYSFIPVFFFGSHFKFLYIISTTTGFLFIFLIFRKCKILAFGLLWFLISLFPCAGILPMPWPLMEHRLYLPSVGIFMCIAYGFFRLLNSGSKVMRICALLFFALFTILSSTATYQRNSLFDSEFKIWESTVKNNPASTTAQKFLVHSLMEIGRNKIK